LFFLIFFCLFGPFEFAFAFPPISNLLIVPLLHLQLIHVFITCVGMDEFHIIINGFRA
jgi:hypothetical protein